MDGIKITWLGTASVKIETPEAVLITDPFITPKGAENAARLEDFYGADAVLITHAHLDHLASLPRILSEYAPAVYCTECAARLIKGYGNTRVTGEGSSFSVGDISVSVFRGKHIRFDRKLILHTLNPARLAKNCGNLPRLLADNARFREKDETVFYELKTGGKRLQIMGSLALRENTDYPTGADMLFLPYQGSSYLEAAAEKVIGKLGPKAVTATHFDNAFPPISRTVDTSGLLRMAAEKFPDIKIIIPEFKRPMIL